jgi:uncharacterized damage-inducible protein DinB
MISFFRELFEYNHHFNQQLAEVFTAQPTRTTERAIKLFNHILNAHQVWNSRITAERSSVGPWDLRPISELKEVDSLNYANSIRILYQADLDIVIKYRNSRGDSYTNSVKSILFHVINHSTYHRGQIATEFKQNGIEPLVTDYIFYTR